MRGGLADRSPRSAPSARAAIPADDDPRPRPRARRRRGAAAYGRIGVSTTEFGTVWRSGRIQLLNLLTGNLDRIGGAMFTSPAIDVIGRGLVGRGHRGAWRSRVRGLPETGGELPVAALREEIETPGDGPGPRAADHGRQPGALDARRRAARPGARLAWTSWPRSTSTSTRRPATPT